MTAKVLRESVAQTLARVRDVLRAQFPDVPFDSKAEGATIKICWIKGPAIADIKRAVEWLVSPTPSMILDDDDTPAYLIGGAEKIEYAMV